MVRATGVKLCTQFLNNVSRHWNMSFESMREATEQQISNHSFEINFIYFFYLKKWEENALREWSSSTRPKSASQFWTKWSGLPFIKWKELNKNFSTSGEIQQQHLFPHRMTVFMQTMFWVRTFDGICAILLLDWLSKNDVKATEPNLI